MRWQQQLVTEDADARLPGYRDVTVRHFDAPEAVDTRFYEVHAKSILNRVPEASRVPFRWTINPYRGCSHSCNYCASGETRIMMADGTTRELQDLAVGDRIVGTEFDGKYRRLVETSVLAKWSSLKPAYAIELSDGTRIVASPDHRFLSDRGWKHVTGAGSGPECRPHLTVNNRLLGPGGDALAPVHNEAYQTGYLCGMVRGDGTLGTYEYTRSTGRQNTRHSFRLALTDHEALARSQLYLRRAGIFTNEFLYSAATEVHREARAIRTQRRAECQALERLIEWPTTPSPSWLKGFLAGVFDAEGGCSRGVLRISNTDEEITAWISRGLTAFGFRFVVDRYPPAPAAGVRIVGGIGERLRFFNTVDPAILRKRSVIGAAIKSVSAKRIVSITPLGVTQRMYDITTGTEDFIANGVVSHNCFARPTHEYLDFNAGRDFEREIVVKVNAPERLAVELARPRWAGEHVALGTNTDPYQWAEGRYELMPGIWRALADARNPCSVLTKSPLLLRDLELMRELDAITDFSAALSIPTLDKRAWRATEPRSPNPRARLEAVAQLSAAGIRTSVLVAPLMPGINDSPAQVREVVRLASEAGAVSISGLALHLRRGVREVFMEWLAEARPELVPRYEALYRRGAYMPLAQRRALAALIEAPPATRSQRFGHASAPSVDVGRDPAEADVRPDQREVDPQPGPGHPLAAGLQTRLF